MPSERWPPRSQARGQTFPIPTFHPPNLRGQVRCRHADMQGREKPHTQAPAAHAQRVQMPRGARGEKEVVGATRAPGLPLLSGTQRPGRCHTQAPCHGFLLPCVTVLSPPGPPRVQTLPPGRPRSSCPTGLRAGTAVWVAAPGAGPGPTHLPGRGRTAPASGPSGTCDSPAPSSPGPAARSSARCC